MHIDTKIKIGSKEPNTAQTSLKGFNTGSDLSILLTYMTQAILKDVNAATNAIILY